MILDTLKNAGLTDAEIKIYEVLLSNGGQFAGKIISLTGLKRGDCYNKIYDLIERNLVVETTKNNKKYFELNSPDTIETYIEKQIENLSSTQKEIKSILPNMLSTYNLAYHKPGVKFFEGVEGMKKISEDSLKAKTPIDSYVDVETLQKYLAKDNAAYTKSRQKSGVEKHMIVADNEFNRKYFEKIGTQATEVHFMKYNLGSFGTVMQIYDDKISYLTLKPGSMIGVIIEDAMITQMHRRLFQFTWEQTQKG